MKKIDVFQCELRKSIPLEYIGRVKYTGESFGVDSLTDKKEYDIVKDFQGDFKVADDSNEDYLYNLQGPRPIDGSSKGGKFIIIEDYTGELESIID